MKSRKKSFSLTLNISTLINYNGSYSELCKPVYLIVSLQSKLKPHACKFNFIE